MRKVLRVIVALALLFEAAAFAAGAMLHVGVLLPVPWREIESLRFAVLEAASGALLLLAFAATVAHKRKAWKLAVVANVVGVASIAYGIVVGGGGQAARASHHQPMLVLLILALVGLSIPYCRQVLENGRRSRRRRRILQTL